MNDELIIGNPGYAGSFVQGFINFSIMWFCPIVLSILSVLVIADKYFGLEWLF